MGWLSYSALMDLAGVLDKSDTNCKQAGLDTIFKVYGLHKSQGSGLAWPGLGGAKGPAFFF